MLTNVTDMLLGPPTCPIGMYPLKTFYDGNKYLNYSTLYFHCVYFEYLFRILILCFPTALQISVTTEGDPREFYVRMIREYFPEFQMHFGFAMETSSMSKISPTYFTFFS